MTHNEHTQARRLEAYIKVCKRFELDPNEETCAAEDYHGVIAGDEPLTRFVHITQSGSIVYVEPSFDDLHDAFERALENITDNLHSEAPLAVVDLDTGNTYRPQWGALSWRMDNEQIDVPMRPTGVYDPLTAARHLATQTGDTPGSRYGDTSRECASYALAWLMHVTEDSDDWTVEAADDAMSLVVNDSHELAEFLPGETLAPFYEAARALILAVRSPSTPPRKST